MHFIQYYINFYTKLIDLGLNYDSAFKSCVSLEQTLYISGTCFFIYTSGLQTFAVKGQRVNILDLGSGTISVAFPVDPPYLRVPHTWIQMQNKEIQNPWIQMLYHTIL